MEKLSARHQPANFAILEVLALFDGSAIICIASGFLDTKLSPSNRLCQLSLMGRDKAFN